MFDLPNPYKVDVSCLLQKKNPILIVGEIESLAVSYQEGREGGAFCCVRVLHSHDVPIVCVLQVALRAMKLSMEQLKRTKLVT